MMLGALVEELGGEVSGESEAVEILDVRLDSRRVERGDLFCALPGARADGALFIAEAERRGAVCILAPRGTVVEADIPVWTHEDARGAFGAVAARVHDDPSRALRIVAVTGTNGKTTVAQLAAQLLEGAGQSAACLGTLGHRVAGEWIPTRHTTPDAGELQRLLARHRRAGGVVACLEASSHALDQGRLAGLAVDIAVFTNLSVDHLDYHGDFEEYARAKRRLFEALEEGGVAIVCGADPRAEEMAKAARGRGARVVRYGVEGADLWAQGVSYKRSGTSFELVAGDERLEVTIPLLGAFGVENALAAAAVALECGLGLEEIGRLFAGLTPPAGRMEVLDIGELEFCVVIDFAHTSEALAGAMDALRPLVGEGGKLIVVFGCGGEREVSKRGAMGRVAAAGAERVFITSDNPRGEDPLDICRAIAEGVGQGAATVSVEPDRKLAIRTALRSAGAEDVVLIAGKGHETHQEIGGELFPFDDRLVVAEELAR